LNWLRQARYDKIRGMSHKRKRPDEVLGHSGSCLSAALESGSAAVSSDKSVGGEDSLARSAAGAARMRSYAKQLRYQRLVDVLNGLLLVDLCRIVYEFGRRSAAFGEARWLREVDFDDPDWWLVRPPVTFRPLPNASREMMKFSNGHVYQMNAIVDYTRWNDLNQLILQVRVTQPETKARWATIQTRLQMFARESLAVRFPAIDPDRIQLYRIYQALPIRRRPPVATVNESVKIESTAMCSSMLAKIADADPILLKFKYPKDWENRLLIDNLSLPKAIDDEDEEACAPGGKPINPMCNDEDEELDDEEAFAPEGKPINPMWMREGQRVSLLFDFPYAVLQLKSDEIIVHLKPRLRSVWVFRR
jgi:hypothetical protein